VRCKTCHYSLANLTEHRCPECGKRFDPKVRASFLSEFEYTMRRDDRVVFLSALLVIIAIAGVIALLRGL
jgi:hypothetical protein